MRDVVSWVVVYRPDAQCGMYRVLRHYLKMDPDVAITDTRKTADPLIVVDNCATLHATLEEVHASLSPGLVNVTFPNEDETIIEVWLE